VSQVHGTGSAPLYPAPLYPLQDFKALYKYCVIIIVVVVVVVVVVVANIIISRNVIFGKHSV